MTLEDGDYSKLELRVLAMKDIPRPAKGPTTGRLEGDSTFQKLVVAEGQDREVANPFGRAYGPHVKIVCKPAAAPSCDLVVMVKICTKTSEDSWIKEWVEVGRFNDMSDDYAHTNADALARAERRKITEGEV